jgi:hypothetical protein
MVLRTPNKTGTGTAIVTRRPEKHVLRADCLVLTKLPNREEKRWRRKVVLVFSVWRFGESFTFGLKHDVVTTRPPGGLHRSRLPNRPRSTLLELRTNSLVRLYHPFSCRLKNRKLEHPGPEVAGVLIRCSRTAESNQPFLASNSRFDVEK